MEEPYRPNFTMPGDKGPVLDQPRLPNNVQARTALTAPAYQPNFTMGAQPIQQPPATDPRITDVRPKWNPANASPEAKAFMESRAPAAAAPAAAPAPTAAPAAAPAAPAGPSAISKARAALNASPVARTYIPAAAFTGAMTGLDTPTEVYRQRFGLGPNEGNSPYSMAARDLAVRALGVGSDVGNAMLLGLPGLFYRDKMSPQAAALTPPAAPAAAPAGAPVAMPPPAVTGAPAPGLANDNPPAAPSNATRVGNSYSGPANISGDITINGAAPRGNVVTADSAAGGGLAQSGADQALQAARMAAIQRGDIDSVRASFGGDFGPKVDPVQALINNGRPMTTRKAQAIAALMQARGNPDAAAKTKAETEGQQMENAAARELLRATQRVSTAKTAGERAKAIETLRALQGKYDKELPNRFTVVPGGEEIGPDGVTVLRRPAMVINNQTGEPLELSATRGGGPTPRAEYDKMKKGDRYIGTDGKTYIKG